MTSNFTMSKKPVDSFPHVATISALEKVYWAHLRQFIYLWDGLVTRECHSTRKDLANLLNQNFLKLSYFENKLLFPRLEVK